MEIREAICTTFGAHGVHHAAMGVVMAPDGWSIRPYPETRTLANLTQNPTAWLSFMDEALPLVLSALGYPEAVNAVADPAGGYWVQGAVQVVQVRQVSQCPPDAADKPYRVRLEIVRERTLRAYHGVNRAYGALLEAAVAATRVAWLGVEPALEALSRAKPLIEKTGTGSDWQAYAVIQHYMERKGS
jgi:hypothetical protein